VVRLRGVLVLAHVTLVGSAYVASLLQFAVLLPTSSTIPVLFSARLPRVDLLGPVAAVSRTPESSGLMAFGNPTAATNFVAPSNRIGRRSVSSWRFARTGQGVDPGKLIITLSFNLNKRNFIIELACYAYSTDNQFPKRGTRDASWSESVFNPDYWTRTYFISILTIGLI